jgi:predicted RNase H-like nuclease (RuvC/YqgF family)
VEDKKLDEINLELQGKTAGYMADIEKHQAQLAPWTEKINETKKAVDIKNSESDILKEKISSGAKAVEEAEKQIEKLVATKKKKVRGDGGLNHVNKLSNICAFCSNDISYWTSTLCPRKSMNYVLK